MVPIDRASEYVGLGFKFKGKVHSSYLYMGFYKFGLLKVLVAAAIAWSSLGHYWAVSLLRLKTLEAGFRGLGFGV